MDNRNKSILLQRLRFLFLTGVGILAFEAMLPFAARYGADLIDLPYSNVFALLLFFVGITILLFLVTEPIRIRLGHWRLIGVYPPLWLSVISALLVVTIVDGVYLNRPFVVSPDWVDGVSILFIAGALGLALVARQLPIRFRKANRTSLSAPAEITWKVIDDWIKRGERAVEADEVDFFGHRPIAQRIVNALLDPTRKRSVSLIGPFGSGKSGIMNAVRALLLNEKSRLIVVAEMNAWALVEPEDAPGVAIDRIISALDAIVDTQRCRGLSSTYRRLAAAEPSGILEKLLGSSENGDPIEQLARLDSILLAIDATVVLIIEDAERAGASFDSRHLERLLWALGKSERITYVVAYAQL